jgi:hypothetical protein
MRTLSLLTLVLAGAIASLGCKGADIVAPSDDTPTLNVLPSVTTIGGGRFLRLTAQVKHADGSTTAASGATWQSSNGAIATVDATGMVHGLKSGRVQILAQWSGARSSSVVTVLEPVKKVPSECSPALRGSNTHPGLCP